MAFDAVDIDGSGDLDASEIYTIIEAASRQLNLKAPSAEDINNIIMELDDSKDGKID